MHPQLLSLALLILPLASCVETGAEVRGGTVISGQNQRSTRPPARRADPPRIAPQPVADDPDPQPEPEPEPEPEPDGPVW